jgi:hypothetical protein
MKIFKNLTIIPLESIFTTLVFNKVPGITYCYSYNLLISYYYIPFIFKAIYSSFIIVTLIKRFFSSIYLITLIICLPSEILSNES